MVGNKENAAGMYQCGLCKAEYGRADHLVRHVRSHTKQRPFICTVCGKGFARQDLLKRHLTTHTKDASNSSEMVAQAEAAMLAQLDRHGHRVSQACRLCAAKKVKCTNSKPCERCREHGLQCDYEQGPVLSIASPSRETGHGEVDMPDAQLQEHVQSPPVTKAPVMSEREDGNDSRIVGDDSATAVYDLAANIPPHDFSMAQNDAVQDILNSTLTLPDFGDYIDIDADPVLGDIDLTFLNDCLIDYDTTPSLLMDTCPSTNSATGADTAVPGLIAEVYRSSKMHERWGPEIEGKEDTEHQDLNLPPGTSSECLIAPTRSTSMLKKSLSSSTRDRILAMVFQTCSPQARERVVESFPTLQVLGDLINFAFVKMADLQDISMIHVSSFDVSKQRPELLAALIAYGSICSPSAALRRFGYAIQEAVRVAITQLAETRQAVLKQQDVCQAFYIQLYLAYWSASKLKIEMAESMSMMGTTLLRRGKWLQRHNYHSPEYFLSLPGLSLHEQWLNWVEQESRKRLVYFAFILDAQISASRDTNILFPYSEMDTPLPSALKLWKADTAVSWQKILVADSELCKRQPESLCSVLRRPYPGPTDSTISDAKCSNMAILAGFWAFVHEYQAMNAVLRPVHSWNGFVLNSRHSELYTGLQQFTADLFKQEDTIPEVLIVQSFVNLHLNVAFYELSKYAGIGTDADARLAMPYVHKWFESSYSRAALWHAGQIFRASKLMASGSLNDVYSVALYHAAVTLWAWGLLSRTQGTVLNDTAQTVALDGDETPAVSRFLKAWRSVPGLTSTSGQFMSIYSLSVAPDLAHEIIISNWGTQLLPLTADEVSRLMQGISGICKQKFKEIPG